MVWSTWMTSCGPEFGPRNKICNGVLTEPGDENKRVIAPAPVSVVVTAIAGYDVIEIVRWR